MGEGWQLIKIRGIPLRIHPSWFLILGVITWASFRFYSASFSSMPPGAILGVAFLSALLLFASVLLHELGHSLVALHQGVKVRSITLFLLGGVATVERECSTPMGALLVAAAGPAVSLVLGFALLAGAPAAFHQSPILGELARQLGSLNLFLAMFNLLPGLPLDGGLILKALVWQITGSQRRGVEVANSSGRFLSMLAVALGVVLVLQGGGLGAYWLILLGFFGLGTAANQRQMLLMQRALKELKVKDVAQRRFRVLEASSSLRQLSQLRLKGPSVPIKAEQQAAGSSGARAETAPAVSSTEGDAESPGSPPDWLLVCDRGRWQGVIDDMPLQQLPVQRWDSERLGDHLRPLSDLPSIPDAAPLWQAALKLEENDTQRLLVLSPAGLPSGTIEKPELCDGVLRHLGVRLPAKLLAAARRQNGYPQGLNLGQVARAMVRSGEVDGATEGVGR